MSVRRSPVLRGRMGMPVRPFLAAAASWEGPRRPDRGSPTRHPAEASDTSSGFCSEKRFWRCGSSEIGHSIASCVSAVTTAWFNGSPLLVLGGRAPQFRWGTGSLQELDQPPLLAPVTKHAATVGSTERIADDVDTALRLATSPHRGPVFLDVAMDQRLREVGPCLMNHPRRTSKHARRAR